jgi:hypothetical protein
MGDLEQSMVLVDRFKLIFDKDTFERKFKDHPELEPGTHEDIRRCFRDFLQKIYCHVRHTVTKEFQLVDWSETTIHFVFSVPVLWDGCSVAKDYETIVREAGFGGGNHFVEFELNEAEASAIYTAWSSKHLYLKLLHGKIDPNEIISPAVASLNEVHNLKQGDVILVVDSGGGTTVCIVMSPFLTGERLISHGTVKQDIATLEVKSIRTFGSSGEEVAELNILGIIDGLSPLSGRSYMYTDTGKEHDMQNTAVGSVKIDEAFQNAVEQRLELIPSLLSRTPRGLADQIARSKKFQNLKHGFGAPYNDSLPKFHFQVLPARHTHVRAGLENGNLVFQRYDASSDM